MVDLRAVSDVSANIRIGDSEGLDLRYVGLFGRLAGKFDRAALIAACTSRAAPSMSRFRSNWSVMLAEPTELEDVISVTPAMRVNCFSRGVATEEAMVSGLAPGGCADTEMGGNSTSDSATAAVSSAVPTGL